MLIVRILVHYDRVSSGVLWFCSQAGNSFVVLRAVVFFYFGSSLLNVVVWVSVFGACSRAILVLFL